MCVRACACETETGEGEREKGRGVENEILNHSKNIRHLSPHS